MTYGARPVLLDLLLPDGSEVRGRPYAEATEGRLRDAGRLVVAVGPKAEAIWTERVVGVEGVQVRREGRPHERIPATVRWAGPDEVPSLWPYARTARRGVLLPPDPPDDVRILVIDLHR